MRYDVGCSLSYVVEADVTFIFNIEVAQTGFQNVLRESLVLCPDLPRRTHIDPATCNRYFSIDVPRGSFEVEYSAAVELQPHRADPLSVSEDAIKEIPLGILPFLLPSRYVSSDRLASFAQAEFGTLPRGHARVNAICSWIYEHLEYHPGSSNEETTADETLLKRAGVCRDFSHLGIAFCRGLGIPARFVSCYADGLVPPDFHAVFEAYLAGRWWVFDATRQARIDGLVRIGVARDAAEVAFSTPFGEFKPTKMQVRIDRFPRCSDHEARTVEAISTSDP